MATPTDKTPRLDEILDRITRSFNPGSRGRIESIKANVCVFCDEPATEFTDEKSKKEYTISGMCQDCQNGAF